MSSTGPSSPAPRAAHDTKDTDPTEYSHWRPLRLLLKAMDDDIARLYAERGAANIRPRFTMPLIRLSRRGPMTIRELAEALELTHSAMSQTVAALRKEGFVTTEPGPDARTRAVVLTERAERLIPFLEAEWLATETAVAELEAEVPYSLSQVVADLASALERKPFRARIENHLSDVDLPTD